MGVMLDAASRIRKLDSKWVMLPLLGSIISIVYAPVFGSYYNGDDFSFLRYFFFELGPMLEWQQLDKWLIGGIVNYSVFRPMAHAYWLLHYLAFGLEPLGYHVAAALFHLAASYAAFVLGHLLTRNRMTAAIGAVVFAVIPSHAEAVSWVASNYELIAAMYYFTSVAFYILYREKRSFRFYVVSFAMFVLAFSSREVGLTLPAVLILYDILYHPLDWAKLPRQLIGYVPFAVADVWRITYFGHGYRGLIFAEEGWGYYVDFNLLRVLEPFYDDLGTIRWVALGSALLLLVALRFRRPVLFCLAWIPIALVTTTVGGVNDRSFYTSSFALALLFGIVFTSFLENKRVWAKAIGLLILVALIGTYSVTLYSRNQVYLRASQVVQAILDRVKELHPTVPPGARLVFTRVPDSVPEGPPVFGAGLREAITILYRDSSLQVFKRDKFPVWVDNLDNTLFFQLDHRRVSERRDLIETLNARRRCSAYSRSALKWEGTGLASWEPWNDLEGFETREGALVTRSVGNDPVIASPEIDIPALAIGDIEITMRVRAGQPTFEGRVYWLATGQRDFYPGLEKSFVGQADGESHTYRVDVASSGMLLIGDRITRLRFDPAAGPAEIAIQSIQVNVHCVGSNAEQCICQQ